MRGPGYGGGGRSVEEITVDNPLATLGLELEGGVKTSKTVTTVNVTESPVEHMFHRGEIDERLRKAADIFRSWCEHATHIGNSINYDTVVVDCSRRGLGFPERAVAAVRQLQRARDHLGAMDFDLLTQAVAIGNSVRDIAARWYPGATTLALTIEARRHIGRRIKDALNMLAELVGLGELRHKPRRPRLYTSFSMAAISTSQTHSDMLSG